jgi:hypothetical protein
MRDVRDKGASKSAEGSPACRRGSDSDTACHAFFVRHYCQVSRLHGRAYTVFVRPPLHLPLFPTLSRFISILHFAIAYSVTTLLSIPAIANFLTFSTASHASSATTLRPCTPCSLTNHLISVAELHATRCTKICTIFLSGQWLCQARRAFFDILLLQACCEHRMFMDCAAAH